MRIVKYENDKYVIYKGEGGLIFKHKATGSHGSCRPRPDGPLRMDTAEWVDYCWVTRKFVDITASQFQNYLRGALA